MQSPCAARRITTLLGGLAAWLVLSSTAAAAGDLLTDSHSSGLSPGEVQLEDVIEVELMERDLFAFDLLGTGSPRVRLDIGEAVLWSGAQGRIGTALTSARALAVSPGSGGWQEVRYRVHETPPGQPAIGKRVMLVMTEKRALGYDSRSGAWIAQEIGPHEVIEYARVSDSTALVVTNRSAYGLSPDAGGFFRTRLAIHERIESVGVKANMATVRTNKRVLIFRAPTGAWSEQRRPLH